MKLTFTAALAAVLAALGGAALADPALPAPPSAPDYSAPASWLCRPGRQDACTVDLTTSVVSAGGAVRREAFQAAAHPAIDCFYVYPTVSTDPAGNSDMIADAAERFVVAQQAARFASQCRVFAPMYRQVTLAALRARLAGQPIPADPAMAYGDVKAAWEYYLAHDNNGRGVVLIGHSQGSGLLTSLIAREIDGKPVQAQLVSALLLGANVPVPRGGGAGGVFKTVPTCTSASQTGCLVSYTSFREASPPPENSLFGVPRINQPLPLPQDADLVAACVNPAALLHGAETAPIHSYFAAGNRAIAPTGAPPTQWTASQQIDTPFVSTPGLLTAHCVSTPRFSYLSIAVNADPADPRTDAFPGDVVVGGQILREWGLHLIDANLEMGDLVELVGRQGQAYAQRH